MRTETKTKIKAAPEGGICSLCGDDYQGYGNSAWPINGGKCCDLCNQIVIVRRFNDLQRSIEKKRIVEGEN